ncbi:alpha/beta fold hydrolase [Rossellomorea oryzaecorticis]|jgi:pimeloyl-ACP methyl ester carboxylesterase|uniref:Alpha/beta fold hydrolase n=1 Tax=Rossellomorea oryzaecorticis TaxID=1396505 RepID=A0ABW8VY93_9BACI|nr:alpha/beta hydrolase [[Bacillus] enclensis]MBH9965695.1 alpha/beta hydrolase [[Bacillus] enclensis]QTC40000.1 alpha/beta hydrolase [Bacillus sp. V3]QWC22115.1 alpha/beta hydrolase [Bacillus haikouensis]
MQENDFARTVNVNGAQVYYEYHQHPTASETFVLLHGFLSSSFSFRRLTPLLKETYNVVSIDLPPFGSSDKSKRFIYSYDNLATTVISLLDHLNVRNIHLTGHSMGGQIALNVMKKEPSLVDKGILLCSSGYLKKMKWPVMMASRIPLFHLYVKLWLTRSGIRKNLENVVHNRDLIDDEMMFGYMKPFLEDDIFKALTRMIRDREGDLSIRELKKIETPCLLVWGEHDRVVPLSTGHRLAGDLPQSKLVVLKDTGHLVPEEKPEEVLGHIRQFINSEAEGYVRQERQQFEKGIPSALLSET